MTIGYFTYNGSFNFNRKCRIRCCKRNYCNGIGKRHKHHIRKKLPNFKPTKQVVTTYKPTTSTVEETSILMGDIDATTVKSTTTLIQGDQVSTTSLNRQKNKTTTLKLLDHIKLIDQTTQKVTPIGEKSRDRGNRSNEEHEDYSMPSLLIMVPCACVFGIIVSLVAWKLIKKS